MMLDQWRAADPFTFPPDRIIDVVAHMYDLDRADILGPSRVQPLARRRQLVCWLMRDMLGLSYPQIGRALNRDHSTVIHSVRLIDRKLTGDVQLMAEVQTLRQLISGRRASAAA